MDRPLNVYYIKLFFFSSDLMKLGEVVVCIESRIKFVILVDFVELIHIGSAKYVPTNKGISKLWIHFPKVV